ncbi:MAG TPA: pectate lyase [Gemmataceae bacterium]|nr:pectate lyase [Gemmataceae bacterium]
MLLHRHVVRWLPVGGLLLLVLAVPRAAGDTFQWSKYEGYPDAWYDSFEAKEIARNVLSWQSPAGSWPQDIDTGENKYEGDPKELKGTFESGASTGELRYLARIFRVGKDERYGDAFDKGLKHILDAQYPTGGWPAFAPPPKMTYERHIAFHDYCQANILHLLREIANAKQYSFLRKDKRDTIRDVFERGIECMVKCQIVVKNQRTGWCALHDEVTLQPRAGSKYEPVAIYSAETASNLLFLMTVKDPSPAVIKAVHGGCQWQERVKLAGIKLAVKDGVVAVVRDTKAPYLWTQYYEIETGKSMFLTQNATVKYKFTDIEPAMRGAFMWYGPWGRDVISAYAKWKTKFPQ